jgi:transcriptional regulator with XRE-family HTH domain
MSGENPKRYEAGKALAQKRKDKEWKQEDVYLYTRDRFGDEYAILPAQISRIERGQFDRVSLDDAVRLGQTFGMSPNEIATLYGLWEEPKSRRPEEIQSLESLLKTLPDDLRVGLLWQIQFATAMIRDEMIRRLRDDK